MEEVRGKKRKYTPKRLQSWASFLWTHATQLAQIGGRGPTHLSKNIYFLNVCIVNIFFRKRRKKREKKMVTPTGHTPSPLCHTRVPYFSILIYTYCGIKICGFRLFLVRDRRLVRWLICRRHCRFPWGIFLSTSRIVLYVDGLYQAAPQIPRALSH